MKSVLLGCDLQTPNQGEKLKKPQTDWEFGNRCSKYLNFKTIFVLKISKNLLKIINTTANLCWEPGALADTVNFQKFAWIWKNEYFDVNSASSCGIFTYLQVNFGCFTTKTKHTPNWPLNKFEAPFPVFITRFCRISVQTYRKHGLFNRKADFLAFPYESERNGPKSRSRRPTEPNRGISFIGRFERHAIGSVYWLWYAPVCHRDPLFVTSWVSSRIPDRISFIQFTNRLFGAKMGPIALQLLHGRGV